MDTDEDTDMTRSKRVNKRRRDQRFRPHLLRNQWNEFAPDPERRAKFFQELCRLAPEATGFDWGVSYEAAIRAGYTARHARRLADQGWVLKEPEEQEGRTE